MNLKVVLFILTFNLFRCEKVVPETKLGLRDKPEPVYEDRLPLVKKGVDRTLGVGNENSGWNLGIIGGQTTNITQHPYQIAIDNAKNFVCSGALINRIWVIALASCTAGAKAENLEVRVGSNSNVYGGTLFNVSHIFVHPNFNYTGLDYDFSLLKLQSYICFDPTVSNIEFSLSPPQNQYIGTISGWGTQKNSKGSYKQLQMRIIYNKWCQTKYTVTGDTITDRMFCALAGQKGPCFNDFGDPLVVNGTLYGLYSWSRGCANPDYPAVFTNLATVKDWIHSTMNNNNYCSCF